MLFFWYDINKDLERKQLFEIFIFFYFGLICIYDIETIML